MQFRTAALSDHETIKSLYRVVAAEANSGLARTVSEITDEYISTSLNQSLERGLIILAEHDEYPNGIVGVIHAFRPEPSVFHHVLSNLTIAIHPAFQGKKIGRTLFTIFLEEVAVNHPDIGKVELVVRESNHKAIKLYQSLGFTIEGRLEMRIKSEDGNYEADIPMGWHNPRFDF